MAFDASTEIKNLKAQKKFREMKAPEQDAELGKRFLAFAQAIERDKLLHFILADQQPNRVLILKGPTDGKEQKKFLGYEWSSAKGGEGIKLIKDAQGHHLTPLYDETNRDNAGKLNSAVARNFEGALQIIPTGLESYLSLVPLVELLDFSRESFEKVIALTVRKSVAIESRWPQVKLGEIAIVQKGVTYSKDDQVQHETPNAILTADNITLGGNLEIEKTVFLRESVQIDESMKLKAGDIFICLSSGSRRHVGKVCFIARDTQYFAGGFMGILRNTPKILSRCLFELMNAPLIRELVISKSSGANIQNLSSEINEARIPLPPLDVQQKIIVECTAVDAETEAAQAKIKHARRAMENAVNAVYASNSPREAIVSLSLSVQYGLNEAMNEGGVGYKIFRMNEIFDGRMVDGGAMKHADITAEEFASYRLNRGDVLFNRTNSIEHVGKTGLFDMEGDYCFASYLVRVVPDRQKVLPLFLTAMMNSAEFQSEAKGKAAKSINQANINATTMKQMKVPVPPLPEQRRLVTKIETLEAEIVTGQALLSAAPARKDAILKKYL